MKQHAEAFGQLLYDFLRGDDRYEIVERSDGYVDVASLAGAYFSSYEEWPSQKQEAMRYVMGRTLDIGCGAGRMSLYLQEQGHDVIGIDVSSLAVKVCRLRGVKQVRRLSITQLNAPLGHFDTLLMMGNNFGLMSNYRRARWLLRKFNHMTTGKGRIIAETLDPYQTSNPLHHAYHRTNRQQGRMGGQVKMRIRYKNHRTPWFDYLFVSKAELHDILAGTGWRASTFFDSEGPGYIAVIEKAK